MSITKSLDGEILGTKILTKSDIGEMYRLMNSHYNNMDIETFQGDLSEKKDVILLRESDGRSIKGFSTLMLLEETVNGNPITALFSGDTIIDKEYWGTNELPKMWGRYAFSLIDEMPDQELYWFLMSKGYKTYRFLPVFFNEFYPRRGVEFPERDKEILDTFASSKFPRNYNPQTGIISFGEEKDSLKQGIADIDESRMKNSDVRYFVERNPNWYRGDELACLVKLTKDNFNRVGHKIIYG